MELAGKMFLSIALIAVVVVLGLFALMGLLRLVDKLDSKSEKKMLGYKVVGQDRKGMSNTLYEVGKTYHNERGIYFCKDLWCCEAEGNYSLKPNRIYRIEAKNFEKENYSYSTYLAKDIKILREISGREKDRMIKKCSKKIINYFVEDGIPYEME